MENVRSFKTRVKYDPRVTQVETTHLEHEQLTLWPGSVKSQAAALLATSSSDFSPVECLLWNTSLKKNKSVVLSISLQMFNFTNQWLCWRWTRCIITGCKRYLIASISLIFVMNWSYFSIALLTRKIRHFVIQKLKLESICSSTCYWKINFAKVIIVWESLLNHLKLNDPHKIVHKKHQVQIG